MANTTTNIFESLVVPAATMSLQTPKFSNAMLNYVYTDYKGASGSVGQTMLINVPKVNEADVQNIGSGAVQVTDTDHTGTSITIDQNQSVTKRIQNFDQVRTAFDLQQLYFAPMLESLARKVNRGLANLSNPAASTGFLATNTAVAGAVANSFARADLSAAWVKLMNQGCPMDPANSFFVTAPTPWGNMMADTTNNWIQQYVVGQAPAAAIQQSARFAPQFQMTLDVDQTFPLTSGSKYIGLAFHRYAIGVVTVIPTVPDSGGYIKELVIYPRPDWPVHVQFWYDPTQQGYVIHLHCVYGQKVIRPEWGVQVTAG